MAQRAKTIDLLRVVDLLQEHITPALCRTVFGAVRKTERQRVWTLEALIRFWTAVVLRAPKALSQALVDSLEGRDPTFPRIEASPEAFFQRCRDLRPAVFAEVFQRFTTRLVTAVPPRYAAEVAPVRARFTAIVILDGLLEDWLVRAGTGASAPRQVLRYIRWRRGGTRDEVLTNVLAPARLSAEEALDLYPYRWSVERMFFDLKEVLNLNRLYAANPNAVAMQVYAAAIVYNTLRVAQSEGAAQVGWAPEQLSPAKFYPKVATATYLYLHRQQWEREIRMRYRHLHLRLVGGRRRWVRAAPEPVQVEHRADHRRTRRFCPARRHWKSFAHVRGGRRFTKLSWR